MRTLKITNVLVLIVTLAVNFLSVTLPLNGKTPRQLSDQYPNYFTPAPVTFSIWSVIYLSLMAFLVWQFLPFKSADRAARREAAIGTIGWNLAAINVLNALWLVAWHYEQLPLSVVVMLGIFGLLFQTNARFLQPAAPAADIQWFVKWPLGLYWGWISVALMANTTAWLVGMGWTGGGVPPAFWAMLLVAVAMLVAQLVGQKYLQLGFLMAVTWACWGVYIKQTDPSNDLIDPALQRVARIAGMAGLVGAGAVVYLMFKSKTTPSGS